MKHSLIVQIFSLLIQVFICFFLCFYGWAYGGIFGFALCFAVCACWLGWSSSGILSAPFGNLFYSDSNFVQSPPAYSRPEHMVARGEYLAALEEYNKIIAEYNDEPKAFSAILEVCLIHLNRPDLAKKFLERGLETLEKESSREEIRRCYDFFLSKKEVSYSGAKELSIVVDPAIVKQKKDLTPLHRQASVPLLDEKPRVISLKKVE